MLRREKRDTHICQSNTSVRNSDNGDGTNNNMDNVEKWRHDGAYMSFIRTKVTSR